MSKNHITKGMNYSENNCNKFSIHEKLNQLVLYTHAFQVFISKLYFMKKKKQHKIKLKRRYFSTNKFDRYFDRNQNFLHKYIHKNYY